MTRETSLLAAALLGFTSCTLLGQERSQPIPPYSQEVLPSQQLILWARLQKPQPVPQPLPPPDKYPDPQPSQSVDPQVQDEAPIQTFSGKILRDGSGYVLKVSNDTAYQLDQQGNAEQYADKDVRVVGALDRRSNVIRVVKIELIS